MPLERSFFGSLRSRAPVLSSDILRAQPLNASRSLLPERHIFQGADRTLAPA